MDIGCGYARLLSGSEEVTVGVELTACTVHVALDKQSKNSVHTSVVGVDELVARRDSRSYKLGNAYLVDMSVGLECFLDILHVRPATGKDDTAKEFVGIFRRNLIPDVLYYLVEACLDNIYKLAALDVAFLVDRVVERVVDVGVVGVGTAILQFHLLGISLFDLQRGDVLCYIAAAEWYNSQMAENVLVVDGNRCRVGSEVDEYASATLLGFAEHAVGKCQWGEIQLSNGNACLVEAGVEVVVELLAPQNVQEVALKTGSLYAYRVDLELLVDLVFLCGCVEDLLVRVAHAAVGVHQFVDHLAGNHRLLREFLYDDVADAADGLSAYSDINLCYLTLKLCLKLVYDVGYALSCLGNVVDDSLADAL